MKWLISGLVILSLCGCSGGSGVSKEDSMSSQLEQAKKDQGLTGDEVKPKDSPGTEADKDAKPPTPGG